MAAAYLAGLTLGLALILPIGAQNVFVVSQGLAVGWPRAGWAAVTAACCDTLLIAAGAVGVSGLLVGVPVLRAVLLLGGVALLGHLGVASWRRSAGTGQPHAAAALPAGAMIRRTVAVSLLNPHAILDTVGVIGVAIAAQPPASRVLFTGGTVSASWLWFFLLAAGAATQRRYLTPARERWFDRVSGSIMIVFAAILLGEFVQIVAG